MTAYYNENDPHAAQWLRNLITEGLIPDGHVDERDIRDVAASDLGGFIQHHFFAGIGGWPYALRLAGWPEDRPCVTGSCPCQPFSNTGRRLGTDDERHLWPAFRWLIAQLRPATCFGEQVASADGREWLAGVRADLEAMGYWFGAADLCAASVGAPHKRQRVFWMAHSENTDGRGTTTRDAEKERRTVPQDGGCGGTNGMGLSDGNGRTSREPAVASARHRDAVEPAGGGDGSAVGDASRAGLPRNNGRRTEQEPANGCLWSDYEIVWCDEREFGRGFVARRTQPGLSPLVAGLPFRLADGGTVEGASRAALLRGIGNAIVPQVAAEFIRACMNEGHE